jgi:alpha-beta hydrolase superfamily lysophospholipase
MLERVGLGSTARDSPTLTCQDGLQSYSNTVDDAEAYSEKIEALRYTIEEGTAHGIDHVLLDRGGHGQAPDDRGSDRGVNAIASLNKTRVFIDSHM